MSGKYILLFDSFALLADFSSCILFFESGPMEIPRSQLEILFLLITAKINGDRLVRPEQIFNAVNRDPAVDFYTSEVDSSKSARSAVSRLRISLRRELPGNIPVIKNKREQGYRLFGSVCPLQSRPLSSDFSGQTYI